MMRLILFFMASLMAFDGASWAEDVLPCSVDTVPIQIFNRKLGPKTTLSAARPGWPPSFAAFVKNVTEHIAARLAQENLCLNSVESQERSLIKFFYLGSTLQRGEEIQPLVLSKSLEVSAASAGHLSSPWIDIVIEREPVPSVQAIVRFSERQWIADQAIMAGVPNVQKGMAMPIPVDEFLTYEGLYDDWRQKGKFGELWPEGKVPSDILWWIPHYSIIDGRFIGNDTTENIKRVGAECLTDIVVALIDQYLIHNDKGIDLQYSSILDVADLIPLEKYNYKTSKSASPSN